MVIEIKGCNGDRLVKNFYHSNLSTILILLGFHGNHLPRIFLVRYRWYMYRRHNSKYFQEFSSGFFRCFSVRAFEIFIGDFFLLLYSIPGRVQSDDLVKKITEIPRAARGGSRGDRILSLFFLNGASNIPDQTTPFTFSSYRIPVPHSREYTVPRGVPLGRNRALCTQCNLNLVSM